MCTYTSTRTEQELFPKPFLTFRSSPNICKTWQRLILILHIVWHIFSSYVILVSQPHDHCVHWGSNLSEQHWENMLWASFSKTNWITQPIPMASNSDYSFVLTIIQWTDAESVAHEVSTSQLVCLSGISLLLYWQENLSRKQVLSLQASVKT